MDYDQSGIATTYDEARALTPARRRRWQRLLSAHVDRTAISLVVDLGCGTGRFSEMLAAELGARVIGLDPSEKMINQARLKTATSPVVFGRASAHELPLMDGCVDLVFMSQIYHHLPDPAAVARECRPCPARRWLRMRPHRNARKRCRRAKLLSGGADHARHQLAIRR